MQLFPQDSGPNYRKLLDFLKGNSSSCFRSAKKIYTSYLLYIPGFAGFSYPGYPKGHTKDTNPGSPHHFYYALFAYPAYPKSHTKDLTLGSLQHLYNALFSYPAYPKSRTKDSNPGSTQHLNNALVSNWSLKYAYIADKTEFSCEITFMGEREGGWMN
jgi:hypothetical protein